MLLRHLRDVREREARGVDRVVVRRPDIEAEDDDAGDDEALGDHDIRDIRHAGSEAADRAEREHEDVADEESGDRRDDRDARRAGETGEIRRERAARDERADDEREREREAHRAHIRRVHQRADAADLGDGDARGVAAEHRDGRHRDDGEDRQRLHAEIRRRDHERAADEDDRRHIEAEHLADGQREHHDAHAEPADLRETEDAGDEIRALLAERVAREKMRREAGLARHVREQRRIRAEDEIADEQHEREIAECQTRTEAAAREHRAGIEREAEHDGHHRDEPAASLLADRRQREIIVDLLFHDDTLLLRNAEKNSRPGAVCLTGNSVVPYRIYDSMTAGRPPLPLGKR